jgi:protein-glucosylgalactosylhydroxylysine glucosidase
VRAWASPIDRQALVCRHNVVLRQFDANHPLTLGNGGFAFTVDATGLQTFPEVFEQTTPLGTLSDWGWHSAANLNGWDIDKFEFKDFPGPNGRPVPYADVPGNKMTQEIKWLRTNPHRLDLGHIGFRLSHADGSPARTNELTGFEQTLELWNGRIDSHFVFDAQPVDVETVCDPERDAIAVRVRSPLLKARRLAIRIRFPYGTGETRTADWSNPEAHETVLVRPRENEAEFGRRLDRDTYFAAAKWTPGATLATLAKHEFEIVPDNSQDALEMVCAFSPKTLEVKSLPAFAEVRQAAQTNWNQFWLTGGAIDLSASKDPRWFELERRIVLSEYLTAIQDAGPYPPQETGLTYNSWAGKFHLEMHFWHAAHFALWDRLPLLERSLGYYRDILPRAQGTAKKQGYAGARWPKMTSPSGAESPSPVGPFLIWQEPHPIFFAELCWRQQPGPAVLEKYRDVVFQTADFMASYPAWDQRGKRFVLGPVLQCAQEVFPKDHTLNPAFELSYWRWGLKTAQAWRERLGLARDRKWDDVLARLAQPSVADGRYLFTETTPDSYTNPKWNKDHPAVLGALSFVPDPQIDTATMRNTFEWVWENWNWPTTWGWDYPLMAMTAARLGEPDRAIDALLLDTPKNHYGPEGHVYQRPGLSIYLPANGGLLYAVALMAAGWDGAPKRNAPGFPDNGQWIVRFENLHPAP